VNNKKGEKKKNKKKLRKEISRRKRCEKKENRKKGTGSKLKRLKRPSLTRVCPPPAPHKKNPSSSSQSPSTSYKTHCQALIIHLTPLLTQPSSQSPTSHSHL